MFTGIIRYILKYILNNSILTLLNVPKDIISEVMIGDSIAINGICLTVSSIDDDKLLFFVMEETFNKTNLNNIKYNKVNVELSHKSNERNNGHTVSGHVHGTAKVSNIDIRNDNSRYIKLYIGKENIDKVKTKDSISLDGISLTIVDIDKSNNTFRVSIIPHTLNHTTIQYWNINSLINIEYNK